MARRNRLAMQYVKAVQANLDTQHKRGAWLLFHSLAEHCADMIDTKKLVACFESADVREDEEELVRIVPVVGCAAEAVDKKACRQVAERLLDRLQRFANDPPVIQACVTTLAKVRGRYGAAY